MTTTSRMVFTVSVTLAVAAGNARGQICASHPDGPDVCAKRFVFDSTQPLSDPVLDTHWEVDYSSNPGSPDVRLLIGDVRFQVWSHVHNQPTNPADIGTITVNQTTGYDYELKLRNPSGSAGAASVGSIVLTPPGSHLTRIVGESYIFGALEDELTLESAAQFGYADLAFKTVAGTITISGPATIMATSDVISTGSIIANSLTTQFAEDEVVVLGDVGERPSRRTQRPSDGASDLDESGLALLAELLGVWCNSDLSADERSEVASIANEAIGSASSDVSVDILAKLVEQLE